MQSSCANGCEVRGANEAISYWELFMMHRRLLSFLVFSLLTVARGEPPLGMPVWHPGPYLMLDDRLVVEQAGLIRRVNRPARLADPIVTGYEDGCFQPYFTVIRDPATRRFRMWYGVPAGPGTASQSRLAYIESEDGIHWLRPHRLLETPPIQFGCSVLDEGPGCADPTKRFKYAWWKDGGLQVAASPDGLAWSPLAPGVVVATRPTRMNERLAAQQGLFLCDLGDGDTFDLTLMSMIDSALSGQSGSDGTDHNSFDGALDRVLTPPIPHAPVCKMIIKADDRLRFLRELHRMNIHTASLFPGVDGFTRSIRLGLQCEIDRTYELLEWTLIRSHSDGS